MEGSAGCDENEMDWEEGMISVPGSWEGHSHEYGREVTVEFTDSPSSAQRKRPRRFSAEEKVNCEDLVVVFFGKLSLQSK